MSDAPKLTFKLISGFEMPLLGLGTWKSKPGQVKDAVLHALQIGYRHIDCAAVYENEKEIGAAFAEAFDKKIVRREELFVTSKLWNSFHHPEDVLEGLRITLKDLQLDYLDLYLVHWPHAFKRGTNKFPKDDKGNIIYDDTHYLDTWKAVEKLQQAGLVRSIGLSNFNRKQIKDVWEASVVKPSVLQIETHPYFTQKPLIQYAQSLGLLVTAFAPLGSPDRPGAKPGDPLLLEDPKLIALAKKHNKTPAQVCIAYQLQRGVSVIPKSVTPQRLAENAKVFDLHLDKQDVEAIESINRNLRYCVPLILTPDGRAVPRDLRHPFFPFEEFLSSKL